MKVHHSMNWCDAECEAFKEAIDMGTIRLIDSYQADYDDAEYTKIERGFYFIDSNSDEEYGLKNYPADPKTPLKFCPWCGATITMEDI